MSTASTLTKFGTLNRIDAFHACKDSDEVKRTFNTKQGLMTVMVIVFKDGSSVEFADCGYWPIEAPSF